MVKIELFDLEYVTQLTEKKSKLYEMMGKFPEREQELAEEYFSIEQQIINHYKNISTPTIERDSKNV